MNVSDRSVQTMKERGALRPPPSKVEDYPRGTEKIVDALVRNGWQRKARPATFLAFMDGHPFSAKGIRWALRQTPPGKPPQRQPAVAEAEEQTEEEIEKAREEEAATLAEGALTSRHPPQIALRRMLRGLGIDPSVAANDLSLALAGGLPPVLDEYYEPTTDKFVPAPLPWLFRLGGAPPEDWANNPEEEWARDPRRMASEVRDFYAGLASSVLSGSLNEALETATEEQMAAARDEVRKLLGARPHFAGTDFNGIAGAFVFALAHVVGTVNLGSNAEGASRTPQAREQ